MSPILRGLVGDVAECAPAADQQGEAAFAQAAQAAQQGVVGAGVHVELAAVHARDQRGRDQQRQHSARFAAPEVAAALVINKSRAADFINLWGSSTRSVDHHRAEAKRR
jgi:hypothetical protein